MLDAAAASRMFALPPQTGTNTLALDSLPTFYDPSDPSCLQVPIPSYYMGDSAKKVKSKKSKEKKNNLK